MKICFHTLVDPIGHLKQGRNCRGSLRVGERSQLSLVLPCCVNHIRAGAAQDWV